MARSTKSVATQTTKIKATGTRLSPAIHKALTKEAANNRRSLNAEINLRLEASFEGQPLETAE
jgi:hypothetical protein